MRPSASRDYPEYDDGEKQEAARFLCSDFTSEKGHNASDQDHLHAQPIIDGIVDIERLNKWTEVKKDLGSRVQKDDREALKRRRRELTVDEPVAFERASEIDTGAEPAVADGGAVVEETDDTDDHELDADQEWMDYEDEAAFESQKNDWRGFVFSETYDTVDAVKDQLADEFDRDVVRKHVVELLEERLEDLR